MRERRAHPHLNPPPPKSSPIKGQGRSCGHKLAEYLSLSAHKGEDRESEAMRKASQAWRPHLTKLIDEKVNGVLLATAFQTDQFLFSKRAVRTMDDLKGMKIRVHSVAIAQLTAGLGADPLTIAFAEVYTGLERGTLDGGFTAAGPGHSQKWYEVTKYLVGPVTQIKGR
jgi:TRAP-type C4-dicarboxylate transport system substrate-binding protein